jgi:hypothetical protein
MKKRKVTSFQTMFDDDLYKAIYLMVNIRCLELVLNEHMNEYDTYRKFLVSKFLLELDV